ncbi:MAG TPA: D-alanyl-D-alanine carboxypeptidase [Solirubrobacterales bacterium]|nr:D-alanyl-D-alanine carboxypeptidase [Solirubrobacterales bacterium]
MGLGLSQYRLVSQSVLRRNLGRFNLFHPQRMAIAVRRGAVTLALLGAAGFALPAGAQARGIAPDAAAVTPVAHASAKARKAISAPKLSAGLAKVFRRVGRSGAFVVDASDNRVLFSRKAGRSRILASNSKLFTTATALARFEPEDRLHTTAWSIDDVSDGVSQGLYLRGQGDPALSGSGLAKLADRVRAAGVRTVQGPLSYDDSFLDRVTGIPQHGITSERIGTLSALTIDGGSPGDPARNSAQRFQEALRKDGISIGNSVTSGVVPQTAVQVGDLGSPTMADLIQDTNVPSNNFFAEMLLKDVGGEFGASGSTASGIAVVKRFAAQQGARFAGENGSGLTRRNKASPKSVVKLLDSMIEVDEDTPPAAQADQSRQRDAWINSLAVAGRSGTVAHRMRGTAARSRCHVKTGTLNGVSALSGYCFQGIEDADHAVAFSLLMNRVDVNRARLVQDRMAALIARYRR